MDFFRCHNTEIKIARIFNTYGPRMKSDDGRLISNFITQAISKKPLTIFGSGKQKRSFCYISDLIEGLERLMQSNYNLPVNFGNPNENYSILQIAELINKKLNLNKEMKFSALPIDDPINRKPSIKLAKKLFNWEPHTNISIGLDLTINHFKKRKR
tara:strand:- start:993 stop:1460 length:468 start_codon:yes stop_codon:yes gene_type:complete